MSKEEQLAFVRFYNNGEIRAAMEAESRGEKLTEKQKSLLTKYGVLEDEERWDEKESGV